MKNTHNWDFHFDLILTKVPECWEAHNEMCCPSVGSCGAGGTGCWGEPGAVPWALTDPQQDTAEPGSQVWPTAKQTDTPEGAPHPRKTHNEAEEMCEEEKGQRERDCHVPTRAPPHLALLVRAEEFGVKAWSLGKGQEKCCSNVCLSVSHYLNLFQLTIFTKLNLFSLWQ